MGLYLFDIALFLFVVGGGNPQYQHYMQQTKRNWNRRTNLTAEKISLEFELLCRKPENCVICKHCRIKK